MKKSLLGILFLLPWLSLYSKILFPTFAQAGFEHSVFILVELIFVLLVSVFCQHPKINKQGLLFILAILAWQVSGLISAYLSDHFHASLIKQIEIFIHCLTAYSAWLLLNETKKTETYIFVLCATLAWVLYYTLAKWHSLDDPYEYDWVKRTPLFSNIRHSGYFLGAIFPLLYFPLIKKINNHYFITLALLTAYWTFLLWSGSRGAFISSIIATGLIYYFFPTVRKQILSISTIAFLLGWVLAISAMANHGPVNPFRLLFLDFFAASRELTTASAGSGRSLIWILTIEYMLDHNLWFGIGPNGYEYITPYIWEGTSQPHSGPIQLFSEYGIIGFSILLALLCLFVNNWWKHPGNNQHKIARIALVSICLASATDGHFFYHFSLLLIALISALSLASFKEIQMPSKISKSTLGLLALLIILPLKSHWMTFIEQQFPLTDETQLNHVKSFPSHYRPMSWIYSFDSDPELRSQAIELGKKMGPNHCQFHLMEYFESGNNPDFLPKIQEICASYMLLRTQKIELINIAKEQVK